MANAKHLTSPPGLLQLLHLIFGIIALGCGAASFESQFFRERFFFWSVVTFVIVSVVTLIMNVISGNSAIRLFSAAVHFIGGIILLGAGTLMILSVKYIKNELCSPDPWGKIDECNWDKSVKLAAASFGIINGVAYLLGAVLMVMIKNSDEDYEGGGSGEARKFGRPTK